MPVLTQPKWPFLPDWLQPGPESALPAIGGAYMGPGLSTLDSELAQLLGKGGFTGPVAKGLPVGPEYQKMLERIKVIARLKKAGKL